MLDSNGHTLVLGGVNTESATPNKKVYQLNDKTNQWSAIGALSFSLAQGHAVAWNDQIYCIDGLFGDLFILSFNGDTVTEKKSTPLTSPLKNLQVSIAADKLYVSGLDESGQCLFVMDLLNTSGQWESIESWPTSTHQPWRQIGLYDKLYFFNQEIAFERTGNGKWNPIPTPPLSLADHFAIPCGHAHILFFESGSKDILAFHTITRAWIDTWQLPEAIEIADVLPNQTEFEIIGYDKSITAQAIIPKSQKNLLNYAIIALFIAAMVYVGVRLRKREKNTKQYFRAGSRIPWWASGLSLFATGASALSLMAMPGKSYAEDWVFIGITVASLVTMLPLSLLVFAPIVRRLDIATSNEYLERRFNLALRLCGSILFSIFQLLGRLAGIMIFPAIALSSVFGIFGTAAALFLAKSNFTSIWDMLVAATGMVLGSFVGVFTLGIFTKRANSTGVICGVIASISATYWAQTQTHISPFIYQGVGLSACLIVGYTVQGVKKLVRSNG